MMRSILTMVAGPPKVGVSSHVPAVRLMTTGPSVLMLLSLSLETGQTDQHSGVTGGAARNPIGELMQLVSEMYDARTGRIVWTFNTTAQKYDTTNGVKGQPGGGMDGNGPTIATNF